MSLHYVDCLCCIGAWLLDVILFTKCSFCSCAIGILSRKSIAQTNDIKCFAQIALDATFMSLIPSLVNFCTGKKKRTNFNHLQVQVDSDFAKTDMPLTWIFFTLWITFLLLFSVLIWLGFHCWCSSFVKKLLGFLLVAFLIAVTKCWARSNVKEEEIFLCSSLRKGTVNHGGEEKGSWQECEQLGDPCPQSGSRRKTGKIKLLIRIHSVPK